MSDDLHADAARAMGFMAEMNAVIRATGGKCPTCGEKRKFRVLPDHVDPATGVTQDVFATECPHCESGETILGPVRSPRNG